MTLEGVLQTKAFVLERTSGADGLERMGITRCACTIRSLMYPDEGHAPCTRCWATANDDIGFVVLYSLVC